MATPTVQISLRVTPALLGDLETAARRTGMRSVSAFAKRALEQSVADQLTAHEASR